MNCLEYRDIISAHVDGALTPAENLAVQLHLDHCPRCKQIFAWELRAAKALKQRLSPRPAGHELKQRLFARLGETDDHPMTCFGLRWAWAPGLVIILIIGTVYWLSPWPQQHDHFVDTIARYQHANESIESLSDTSGIDPMARVLDLKPWGYRLLGTSVHWLQGRESRVFVYHGQQNDLLLAQEFEGETLVTPRGSTTVTSAGKRFSILSRGSVHLIAWQENNIVCVLASSLTPDQLIDLATQIVQRG